MTRTPDEIRDEIASVRDEWRELRAQRDFLGARRLQARLDALHDELEATGWTPEPKPAINPWNL